MQNAKVKNTIKQSLSLIQKLNVLLLSILSFAFFFLPPISLAHETQSDNGIGAILHVDPGDSPIAGQPSTLFFEFMDMEEKLDLSGCDCEISIKRGEQEVLKESFSKAAGADRTSGAIDFVFPESDIYKAIVSGKPQVEGQFKPFNLTFLIRVENADPKTITEAHNQPDNSLLDHALHYAPTAIVILVLLSVLVFVKSRKKLAVVILVFLLLGHSLPIKAIHASHDGVHESFVCCLPVSAVLPELLQIEFTDEFRISTALVSEVFSDKGFNFYLSIRSPPVT